MTTTTSSTEINDDERIVAKCYVELGNVTKEKGEYDESLRYHRKSLEIFERIDDALSVADSHLNIAEIYKAKGELKQAMSEYEKGLALYEDVYVEDSNKSNDSGTDVSLNSSSFSDLQHIKSLSKSDETLPHITLDSTVEKVIPSASPRHSVVESINVSTSSLNLINSNTKQSNDLEGVLHTSDYVFLLHPEITGHERRKSLSASGLCDLPYINANDLFPSTLPGEIDCHRTGDTTSEESEILEIALPPVYSTRQNISEFTDGLSATDRKTTNTDLHVSHLNEEFFNYDGISF